LTTKGRKAHVGNTGDGGVENALAVSSLLRVIFTIWLIGSGIVLIRRTARVGAI
jgi:hypothetical protein